MPKLRIISGIECCAILAEYGFVRIRQKGSHIVMQKESGDATITVPVPKHKELQIGTLQSIIRQSGLSKHLFEV